MEGALRNLSASQSSHALTTPPNSVPAQVGETVGTLDVGERAWSDTPTCIEREPSFERQSYMAAQIPELSVPEATGSPAFASYLRTLKDAVSPPGESKPRVEKLLASSPVHMVRIPADFVLQLIRVLNSTLYLFHSYLPSNLRF